MRARTALCGVTAAVLLTTAAATAQAPAPEGNFGGGALVAPPRGHFGPGNAVIGLRALPGRKLEIEASIRAKCAGGEIAAATTVAEDGSFSAEGTERTEPERGVSVTTKFKLAGTFSSATAADGTLTATITRRTEGRTSTCKSGSVKFGARRPGGDIGTPGAIPGARYYGTTAQRGVGPRRPIVIRISTDGRVILRALFGESVRCSDDTRATGIEAPRTNAPIDSEGRVKDVEKSKASSGNTLVTFDDRFNGQFGSKGAKGTLSLSDVTLDKTTGRILQSCRSGVVKWSAAP
ncbi:MAG TPA: hypothetical protein VMY78_05620 [Solirubrobacteraceae bacterium]|nr:hypothetical protein [Solirubrobacteraceae bacterium]